MENYILNLIGEYMAYGVGMIIFCLVGIFILNLFESPEARRDRKIREANIEYNLAVQRRKELLVHQPVRLSPPTELPPQNPPRRFVPPKL